MFIRFHSEVNWKLKAIRIAQSLDHRQQEIKVFPCHHQTVASQVALAVKKLSASAQDIRNVGSIPGLGRSPEGGHGNPLQYSCRDNPMDRGAWQAMVHRVAKSQTKLKQLSTHTGKPEKSSTVKFSLLPWYNSAHSLSAPQTLNFSLAAGRTWSPCLSHSERGWHSWPICRRS